MSISRMKIPVRNSLAAILRKVAQDLNTARPAVLTRHRSVGLRRKSLPPAATTRRSLQRSRYQHTLMLTLCTVQLLSGCRTISGWMAPDDRLSFPAAPLKVDYRGRWYDVNGNGVVDFAIQYDGEGLLDVLTYDDNEDGRIDRSYRISDYDPARVPHLIVLMDSIPYRVVAQRYAAGDFRWFLPPAKIIAPFPSLSVVIFSRALHCPPMPGVTERFYDRRIGGITNLWIKRAAGYRYPWHKRLSYQLPNYMDVGMSYCNPLPWFLTEMYQSKNALDRSSHQVTITYVSASAGMVSLYGREGIDESLDYLEQLCMQLLYERRGAIRISIVSDHGHNFTPSEKFQVGRILKQAGFNTGKVIKDLQKDVVIEIGGLVNYFGVNTANPVGVVDVLIRHPEVQLAFYMQGDRVIIRSETGIAAVEKRDGRFRYVLIQGDPLEYGPVIAAMEEEGKLDADGFGNDRDWLESTCDHEWPDVPLRVWDAFHNLVVEPADVIFTLKDGYCAGMGLFDAMIDMASVHGGINQINSDAMVLTMSRPIDRTLRVEEVMGLIEPRYDPAVTPNLPKRDMPVPPGFDVD